jgi:hypothetical protein
VEQIIAMFNAEDHALLTEIQSLMLDGDTAGIIKAAAKKGFDFTAADWKAVELSAKGAGLAKR